MSLATRRFALTLCVGVLFAGGSLVARDLSFADRVEAQRAIERVYHAHHLNGTRSLEAAIPQELLEQKVLTYLKQSAALEQIWNTPVTTEMLDRELQRITRGTRMPDRLAELFAALDNDPQLIKECLVRATLVDRMTRNFFAFDATIHDESKREATALHTELSNGSLDPRHDHPRRTVMEVDLAAADEIDRGGSTVGPVRQVHSESQFRQWRDELPADVGLVTPLEESRETFHTRVLLEDGDTRLRHASYVIEKMTWDEWWNTVAAEMDESSIVSVASGESLGDWKPEGWNGDPCADDDVWDNGVLDDMPNGAHDHTAVWTGNLMLVWGGYVGVGYSSPSNRGGRYDPATDSWSEISLIGAPTARRFHTAVWSGSEMLVWGGDDTGSVDLGDGGRYDPVSDSWSAMSVSGEPTPRHRHTAVWTGDQMLIWGGQVGSQRVNTGGRYDPVSDSWSATILVDAPSGRRDHSAVWTGTRMFVWGGFGNTSTNRGGLYDPLTDSWTHTTAVGAPSPRWDNAAHWTGDRVLIWGGGTGSGLGMDTGGQYDPATDSWTAISLLNAPSPRYTLASVWTGSEMLIWGGESAAVFPEDVLHYDPTGDSWTASPAPGAPPGHHGHSSVWTGTHMIVWGGTADGGTGVVNSGGRYNPSSGSWTPTSQSAAGEPLPRGFMTATWNGSRMLIWGGNDYDIVYNSGGLYDPATASWTATTTTGAPSGASAAAAIWSGDRFLIWGGVDNTSSLSNGGRYDPLTDSWLPISTTNAPGPRWWHTAVWSGDQMLVWGGTSGSGSNYLNTGGRYDPATDSWLPTALDSAPSPRQYHRTVWSGDRMLVWGGWDGGILGSGGTYDPETDSWTGISTLGAPSSRYHHSIVWAGDEMLVWGGFEEGGLTNSGGKYDPTSDSWETISTIGAPSDRGYHTAEWTGNRMLVWGGADFIDSDWVLYDTGGIYDPVTDSWNATTLEGAASERGEHVSVWTGSKMLVWGGTGGSTLGSGGMYSLSPDDDGDGFSVCAGDCADGDNQIWATPGEVLNVSFATDVNTLHWTAPAEPGAVSVAYEVLSSESASDFITPPGAECVAPINITGTQASVSSTPPSGALFHYLVRATNSCAIGTGTLGSGNPGPERAGAICP